MAQAGAKTIRQLRHERGWSQAALAVKLGVTPAAISNWERGMAVPRWEHLRGLAQLFGIHVKDIAAEQAPQERPSSRCGGRVARG